MSPKRFVLLVFLWVAVGVVQAATFTVTVTDPSGAAVPAAAVHLQSAGKAAPTATTGKDGTATIDLAVGTYQVSLEHQGFAAWAKSVEVKPTGGTTLNVTLAIAPQETAVDVEEKATALANSDPNYVALRNAQLSESFVVENLEFRGMRGSSYFVTEY